MRKKIQNKIKYLKKRLKKELLAHKRRITMLVLSGIMVNFVSWQYLNLNLLAEASETRKIVVKRHNLPSFAPKKEVMLDNGLRCSQKDEQKRAVVGKYSLDQFLIKRNIEKLIADKPMQNMVTEIATRDTQTASYLVAIAKHESNLGKFSPKKDGRDCFNYWGFRGTYNKTKSGYSCFDSPKQAVKVVGNRIQGLTQNEKIDTPEEMLVWKCGGTCAGHDPQDVKRWKENVDFYFKKINS